MKSGALYPIKLPTPRTWLATVRFNVGPDSNRQLPVRQILSDLRSVAICLCGMVSACSTPATRIETVEVKVPVAVQPLKPDQVPTVPAPLGPRPQSLSAAADLLLAKHCEFVAYALKADPLLRLSAGMKQQALARFPECEGR